MTHCAGDSSSIERSDARFSSPVTPGEALAVEMWRRDDGLAFRVRAIERDTLVLKSGLCRMR